MVTDRQQLRELSQVGPATGHVAGAPAAIALVVEDFDDQRSFGRAQYDLGQATVAMMISAADSGGGSGHATVYDQSKARQILEVPEGRRGCLPDRPGLSG